MPPASNTGIFRVGADEFNSVGPVKHFSCAAVNAGCGSVEQDGTSSIISDIFQRGHVTYSDRFDEGQ